MIAPQIPKQRSLTTTPILNDRTPTSPNSDRTQPPNFKRSLSQLIPKWRSLITTSILGDRSPNLFLNDDRSQLP
ncbi:hypothetical protein [Anabaena sp. UHCC 0451]|uniref:hypothetical protein n=1 Tax=Anabaena sp. UHCC 0451 TaxID=2055235 RepID=UPI002B2199B3|nr:hypothetical protein [Anabaena sp. UHCC 0451]MEA5577468.1 hypothetical protein [Anabaena sp. UHCC 0451]